MECKGTQRFRNGAATPTTTAAPAAHPCCLAMPGVKRGGVVMVEESRACSGVNEFMG